MSIPCRRRSSEPASVQLNPELVLLQMRRGWGRAEVRHARRESRLSRRGRASRWPNTRATPCHAEAASRDPRHAQAVDGIRKSWRSCRRPFRSITTPCSPSHARWRTSPVAVSMRQPSSAAVSATHQATSSPRTCRWHRLPIGPALRVGLLTRGGAEFLAGRIVVPDLSGGRPQWLIGRRLRRQPAGRCAGASGPARRQTLARAG